MINTFFIIKMSLKMKNCFKIESILNKHNIYMNNTYRKMERGMDVRNVSAWILVHAGKTDAGRWHERPLGTGTRTPRDPDDVPALRANWRHGTTVWVCEAKCLRWKMTYAETSGGPRSWTATGSCFLGFRSTNSWKRNMCQVTLLYFMELF